MEYPLVFYLPVAFRAFTLVNRYMMKTTKEYGPITLTHTILLDGKAKIVVISLGALL
jgi:hypothetical protein